MGDMSTREKLSVYRQVEGRRRKLESWSGQARKLLDETIIKDLNEVTRRRDMMVVQALKTAVMENVEVLEKAGIVKKDSYMVGSETVKKRVVDLEREYYLFLADEGKFVEIKGSDISPREYGFGIKEEDVVKHLGARTLARVLDKVMDALGMKDTDPDMDGI